MKHPLLALFLSIGLAASGATFDEREFIAINPTDSVELHGTLTMPDAGKPRAALVLVSGSGPQNRDEEIFGHRPFKAIAEYLGAHGFAVLRMDDRGVGESGGSHENAKMSDFTADALAAFEALGDSLPEIPCGILGHSMGGSVAIKIGATNPACKFMITLAAPAWEGDSIIMSQSRMLSEALTGGWENENLQRRLMDVAKSALPSSLARPMLAAILGEAYGDAAKMPAVAERISGQCDGLLIPWYRDMLSYNPDSDIRRISCPWLAMNGTLDTQVLPGNLATIAELNPEVTVKSMEGHNHLFQHATTGFSSEYAQIQEDISDETLAAILRWLEYSIH